MKILRIALLGLVVPALVRAQGGFIPEYGVQSPRDGAGQPALFLFRALHAVRPGFAHCLKGAPAHGGPAHG